MKLPTDFPSLAGIEWLETNGLGGYAMGTAAGAGTRGYHGLLVAAVRPPAVRTVVVTTCDEWLVGEPPVFLSTHQYPGAVSPEGYRLLEDFRHAPFPTWVLRTPTHRLERKLFMVHGENTTVLRYRLLDGRSVRLGVRPFFVFRDHHRRRHASDQWWVAASRAGDAVHCAPSDGAIPASVYFRHGSYREDAHWYRHFEYLRELERGLPHEEDAYAPFVVELELATNRHADLVFTTEHLPPLSADELEREELSRRSRLTATVPASDGVAVTLATAADAFRVIGAGGRHSVIAGYPWFTDWGRDTMITLPGLAAGGGDDAGLILDGFAEHLRDGILPNYFSDRSEEPAYHTVDASLWFAVAIRRLLDAGSSIGERPIRALEEIERCYASGTAFGIHEDHDGLIAAGADGVALTWMDARVGDWIVTPRRGKPVEVSALWYNARMTLAELLQRHGRMAEAHEMGARAARTLAGFLRAFWNPETGALYDLIAPDGTPDGSIRPNQLFAASLPYPLVDRHQASSLLEQVTRHLLTPFGLRTLAPEDPCYAGRYRGDPATRDAAYHQGTVWPWLLGAYADALLYARGNTATTRRRVRELLRPITGLLEAGCLGQLPEIADGDPPHAPNGCPAQAWSVAEVLRAWVKAQEPKTVRKPRKKKATRRRR